MTHIRSIAIGSLILASSTLAAPALAQGSSYIGGGVGYYRINNEDFLDRNDELKDNRSSWKVYAGGRFNEVFGLEAGYVDFRDAADGDFRLSADGYSIAATIGTPVSSGVRLYGKLGQLYWEGEAGVGPITTDFDGEDSFYGVGAHFGDARGLGVRVEYERYTLDETDIDMPSVALQLNF